MCDSLLQHRGSGVTEIPEAWAQPHSSMVMTSNVGRVLLHVYRTLGTVGPPHLQVLHAQVQPTADGEGLKNKTASALNMYTFLSSLFPECSRITPVNSIYLILGVAGQLETAQSTWEDAHVHLLSLFTQT